MEEINQNLELLEKKIEKLKNEEESKSSGKESFSFPRFSHWIYFLIFSCVVGIVAISYSSFVSEVTRTIGYATLVIIVLAIGLFAYHIFELDKAEQRLKLDIEMSIYKEREMSVINLRKSLANKVLDSITLEDKENGNAKREKNDESESSKVKEQHDHEERMAIIKALDNNCSKECISAMLEGIKDIQKSLKDIHN